VPDESLRLYVQCPSPENTSLPADLDGQTPNAVHYDKRTEKPDKSSRQIRAPIEEIRMGNGHLRAYRLKEAA
jgi:hypothetical protein